MEEEKKHMDIQSMLGKAEGERFREVKDVIAPAAIEVSSNYLKIGSKVSKTIFILTYPRYLSSGWIAPVVNLPNLLDVSIFVHPIDTGLALKNLRKKAAEVEAQIAEQQQKGLVRDPMLETAVQDIDALRDGLQQAREKLFNVGVYITIYGNTIEDVNKLEAEINNMMESKLVYAKPALFQQIEGFTSCLPLELDKLNVHTPLNSSPASSLFPFSSTELTSNKGVLYGINLHNNTLIIFDRFSLENANMVIFAKSGGGKSFASKLEIIRSLMLGIDVLVIDPENEYQNLAQAVGGSYFKIALTSEHHINPFDIPTIPEDEEPEEVLRSHIVNLGGLIKLMVGKVTAQEDAIIDRALTETYASREIVPGKDFSKAEPPLLSDFQTILENMEGGKELGQRLYKYTTGSFSGFINQPTNIDIKNRFIAFSIRDLEEDLRPIAMYIILNYIWNLIRVRLQKRILVIDEAWVMMRHEDSAIFLFGLVKRARKYFLGITTITQDVEDFINSPYGRPIVTNSSLQLLLKQTPGTIEPLKKAFNITDSEANFLLEATPGIGLFFAGLKHVAVRVLASYLENQIVTTNPEELLKMRGK